MVICPPFCPLVQALSFVFHHPQSIVHRLLAWPAPSSIDHFGAPNTSLHNALNMTWHDTDMKPHIWNVNSTKKVTKPLKSCVNHSSCTDEIKTLLHLVTLSPPWWMHCPTLKHIEEGLKAKRNSHSRDQKVGLYLVQLLESVSNQTDMTKGCSFRSSYFRVVQFS
jgi:hypothetical protein